MAVSLLRFRETARRHPRLFRFLLNRYPPFRGTGGRVTYIARDWSELRVRLPLSWRTRNVVGTTFGGSMAAAADPHFMFMLLFRLGPDYVVWDKAAEIRYLRPGQGRLHARFMMPAHEVEAIKDLLDTVPKTDRIYEVEWLDDAGVVHATLRKTVQVRRRDAAHLADPQG